MNNYTNLEGQNEALQSITELEKALSEKVGREVVLVAYSPVKYAALNDDAQILAKITDLEQEISKKTGKNVALVAFAL